MRSSAASAQVQAVLGRTKPTIARGPGCCALLVAVASLASAACGARSELSNEERADGDWVLPAGYVDLSECAVARGVPAGKAWVGHFSPWSDGASVEARPVGCDELSDFPQRERWVGEFFLDPDETTEECYAACVDAGACAPAAHSRGPRFPVQVGRADAMDFCRFRGGRLPQLAEFARAEGRVTPGLGQPSLYAEWLACELRYGSVSWSEQKAADPRCRWFAEAARRFLYVDGLEGVPDSLPPEVRSNPGDVGPYGHFDVFGGGWERVLPEEMSTDELQVACSLPDYVDEPLDTDSSPLLHAPAKQLVPAYGFVGAESGLRALSALYEEEEAIAAHPEMMVFRCAYDP